MATALPQSAPASAARLPGSRVLASGCCWRLSEFVCTAGPGDSTFEERHEDMSISAVVEGTFNYRSAAGRATLHPGALLLGNAGAGFECGHDHSAGDRCISFQISADAFEEVAASIACRSRFRFPVAMLPASNGRLPLLARIENFAAKADPLALDAFAYGLAEDAIAAASGQVPRAVRPSARDERRVGAALRHIEAHLDAALRLDALASAAATSKYHFLRVFRQIVGSTPHQYVLVQRLRRAARRLENSAAPISTIAFDAGFGDLSTFNARFRAVFGASPSRYRRTCLQVPGLRAKP
ncbi:MAG: helix-turn-helix transcriptional regulator [Telmatospirillum sp.]|nr:helix-turn-helix transcriptional regulator [Telmatospirillum sp.]